VPDDGFFLRETVAEYVQFVELFAGDLDDLRDSFCPRKKGVRKPVHMPDDTRLILEGGGTLIFDEFGRLKFHMYNRLDDVAKQSARLKNLWDSGEFSRGRTIRNRLSSLHRRRAIGGSSPISEVWI
jgi:hypothetical protein